MSLIIVKTTYPNLQQANELINCLKIALFKQKLASCISSKVIDSSYIWQDQIINESEIELEIKAQKHNYLQIEDLILKNHSYQLPQIIYQNIDGGYKKYLQWLKL